jgi:muramoyltetrapeptide carboxypeptidase LdcA involved in peptidoglycan recycling
MDFNELDNIEFEIVDDSKIEWLISMLKTSSLSNEVKEDLERELETFNITPERYEQLSNAIYNSQIDIINGGFNYSQTDINRKLKKEI